MYIRISSQELETKLAEGRGPVLVEALSPHSFLPMKRECGVANVEMAE